MIGGHLDSVIDGPGINDNGSGTMTILELAERLATLGPTPRTVRFAFWTGEELGLFGSSHWVGEQDEDSLHAIVAYLNFDMVASSNYSRLVYDSSSAVADSRPITADFEAVLRRGRPVVRGAGPGGQLGPLPVRPVAGPERRPVQRGVRGEDR